MHGILSYASLGASYSQKREFWLMNSGTVSFMRRTMSGMLTSRERVVS